MNWNIEQVQKNLRRALAQAQAIAAKASPRNYLQPEIQVWGKQWVYSRFYGFTGDKQGYLDKLQEAQAQELVGTFPEASDATVLSPVFFQTEASGNRKNADAVNRQIDRLDRLVERLPVFYAAYVAAMSSGQSEQAVAMYENTGVALLSGFSTLFNTMLKKMDQSSKPKPVPGPDEMLLETGAGTTIVKKHPGDGVRVGSLTVGQFKVLMGELLGK